MDICRYADRQCSSEDDSYGPPHHFDCPQTRIVLLGKTGVGKSAVGNTILGRTKFESALKNVSVTRQCQKEYCDISKRHVAVIDTPGLFDTDQPSEQIQKEIVRCIQVSCPGPHAFLVVMQLNRFTHEEKMCVEALQKIFGEEADKFMIILFTRGDDLQEQTIHDFVRNAHRDLKEVIRKCENRYLVFNNRKSSNRDQVSQLMDMIERMMAMNGGNFYTQEMYIEAEAKIKEKEEEIIIREMRKEINRGKRERSRSFKIQWEKKRLENTQQLAHELAVVLEPVIDKKIHKMKEEIERDMREMLTDPQRLENTKKLANELGAAVEAEIEKKVGIMKEGIEREMREMLRETRRKAEESDLDLSFAKKLKQKVAKAFRISKQ